MKNNIKKVNDFIYVSISHQVGNIYLLILNKQDVALVDVGIPGTVNRVIDLLNYAHFGIENIKNIFITHADGDHIGNLSELLQINKSITVHASIKTWDYIDQRKMPKHFPSVIEFFLNTHFHKYPIKKIQDKNRAYLNNGDKFHFFNGLQVINSPGHTDDHISFWLEKYKILFSGDVMVNNIKFSKSPRFANSNNFILKESYNNLLSLKPKIICCGHGNVYIDLEESHKKL